MAFQFDGVQNSFAIHGLGLVQGSEAVAIEDFGPDVVAGLVSFKARTVLSCDQLVSVGQLLFRTVED